jgi:simple sugar transport system permease protein
MDLAPRAPLQASARPPAGSLWLRRWLVPVGSVFAGLFAFGLFVAAIGHNPLVVFATIAEGGFASSFAWQNTLLRAAPLILTGLAVALPAQAGLVVIGAEGALAFGALAASVVAVPIASQLAPQSMPLAWLALLAAQ